MKMMMMIIVSGPQQRYEFYLKPFFSYTRSEWDNEKDVG
jgi:hypothetical protein